MEKNFICFTCQHKPIEFTILSCDHLICSTCLEHRSIKKNDFLTVQCRCGRKTLSTEDSMLLSLKTPEMAEVKQQLQKIKFLQNENTRISHFFTNESEYTSKQNTFMRNLERLDKENANTMNFFNHQKYTFNPCGMQYSKYFLKTEPLGLDESEPFLGDERGIKMDKQKIVKGVKSVQSVHSMSPSQKVSSKVSPRKRGARQTPKKKVQMSIFSSTAGYSSDCLNSIAKQLQKELKYLQIQYRKQIETCQKAFNKIKKSIHMTYQKLVGSLQKFYLDHVAQIESKQKDQMVLNLSKVVKKKYQSTVGQKIIQLGENLLDYFNDNEFKKCTQRQIQTRQAIVRHSAQNKIDLKPRKSINKKSRSKGKQCALYLAISPKSKNDRVVNYIEVLKKDTSSKLCKKAQLSKKTIKGDKIRIY